LIAKNSLPQQFFLSLQQIIIILHISGSFPSDHPKVDRIFLISNNNHARLMVDPIVIAPDVHGIHGNAAVPTISVPTTNDDEDGDDVTNQKTNPYLSHGSTKYDGDNHDQPWYRTWS
jgi:hypothetical protein